MKKNNRFQDINDEKQKRSGFKLREEEGRYEEDQKDNTKEYIAKGFEEETIEFVEESLEKNNPQKDEQPWLENFALPLILIKAKKKTIATSNKKAQSRNGAIRQFTMTIVN